LVAADVMTKDVIVCSPNEDVRSVAQRMLERGVKRLPVVEAGTLAGIVSRHDILVVLDRPDEVITTDVERALANDPNVPDDHHVRFSIDDGIVTLTGDVRYEWDAPIVVSVIRGVPGVIDVISHLHHRERNPHSSTEAWMFDPR
jgi:predicted transcriptional regulator